jgi:hypothetical protein
MSDTGDLIYMMLGQRLGEANAIKGRDLKRMLADGGIRIGDRRMRKIIETECPEVCFSGKGYFLPADHVEARQTVDRIEHYIRGLAMRRRAILNKYPDGRQMELGL